MNTPPFSQQNLHRCSSAHSNLHSNPHSNPHSNSLKFLAIVLNQFALLSIAMYRAVGSLWLSGSCRFEPSCSVYAQEAVETYGFYRGSKLALARLIRCRPGGEFGFDPVPRDSVPRVSDVSGCECVGQES